MSKIPELDSAKSKISPIVTSNLFKDLTFQIELFDSLKKSTLSKVIESHSGEIVEDLNPSFLIIPSDFPLENLPSPLQSKKDLLVTEWFIERCLHYKSIKADHWGKIPNINQRDWCVYCPKFANLRKSLQILVDTTDNHTSNKPELTSPKKDQLTKQPSLPKLPSPIRNKRKDNWGRLVDKDINDQIPDSTQISYGNSETNVKLLRLLNREIEDPKKSNEVHDKLEPPRKRTRAGYKEMLDVLDHD
ncbi:unnamed protein product [Wickerhamomyces anomalus]